jgi:hypothetical protein
MLAVSNGLQTRTLASVKRQLRSRPDWREVGRFASWLLGRIRSKGLVCWPSENLEMTHRQSLSKFPSVTVQKVDYLCNPLPRWSALGGKRLERGEQQQNVTGEGSPSP